MAYDILTEKEIKIPKGTNLKVHETFIVDKVEYKIIRVEYPNCKIEVIPLEEHKKRTTVIKCGDGIYRTLKEIELL